MGMPNTPPTAHSMCGHTADGAEWMYKTPRVLLMPDPPVRDQRQPEGCLPLHPQAGFAGRSVTPYLAPLATSVPTGKARLAYDVRPQIARVLRCTAKMGEHEPRAGDDHTGPS